MQDYLMTLLGGLAITLQLTAFSLLLGVLMAAGMTWVLERRIPVATQLVQLWVLIFSALVVAGLVTSLFIPRRRMWVKAVTTKDGVTLEYAGLARGDDPTLTAAVADLAPYSRVLIMSFSHAEDLDVVAACLQRQRALGDLPYVGLIGSKTKWASFRQRLQARGFTEAELAHITCPIGVPGITSKEPEVIAVAVAAQILQLGS